MENLRQGQSSRTAVLAIRARQGNGQTLESPEETRTTVKLNRRTKYMAQNEITLTTALQAAQARQATGTVSTNPAAFSANLTKSVELAPQMDFVGGISEQLDALELAGNEFKATKGKPNEALIALNTECHCWKLNYASLR
jgi:hypothetical protein